MNIYAIKTRFCVILKHFYMTKLCHVSSASAFFYIINVVFCVEVFLCTIPFISVLT